ncbi:hypothetical protein SANTM175S_09514 [Streptomyces antimycoticus]
MRHGDGGRRLGAAELGADLGERATLLQFSSAFCQPCRATRRTLSEVAAMVDGVAHVEIDAESRLELAQGPGHRPYPHRAGARRGRADRAAGLRAAAPGGCHRRSG